ncbi:MAG: sigma-70 family RNA polymerase sigma factor [Mucilaginibacter polytrichastri]|nr:sigma-70 family RNA polymerase sigma factor [Mucilaginibacter polytrichastri]
MSDRSLIWQQFKAGSWSAYTEIYDGHFTQLYNYGHKFTKDTDLIEDCIQDLFTKLWQRRDGLGEPASVKNYLYKAFRNTIISKIQALPDVDLLSDEYAFTYEISREASLAEQENHAEIQGRIKALVDQLPARQREIIFLRFYEDMSYEEIADVMEISVTSAYKLLYKAVDRMQLLMHLPKTAILLLMMQDNFRHHSIF